ITPKSLTVTVANKSRVYGAANPTFTVSYSGFVNSDTASVLSGNPALTTTATVGSPVGSYPITASQDTLRAANYSFSFVNGTLTVTKSLLTVRADDKTRIFGSANPVFTTTYSGFMNGDPLSVISGSPTITTTATTSSAVGSYTITVSQGTLSAGNYSF